jgi:hypothetical protein
MSPIVSSSDLSEMTGAMLDRAVRAAGPVLSSWFGEDGLRETLRQELERDLARVNESGESTTDARIVQQPGKPARWMIAHWQPTAEGEQRPHLLIRHRSFDLASEADVATTVQAACEAFADRPVEAVCVMRHESASDPLPPGAMARTSYVAGLVSHLHMPEDGDEAHDPVCDALRIESPASLAFIEQYEQWYEEFWRRRPELKSHVPIETREDIERFAREGTLRLAYFDDELCGLLAAWRHLEYGLKGWRIREKVIAPTFWGRGLSARATVLFARSLPSRPNDAIWGTIVPGNSASMKSAIEIGRRVIGALYWLPG